MGENKTTKSRLTFRPSDETRQRIEQWYKADNCNSLNDFIEKAVNDYIDRLEINDDNRVLPLAINSAIDGRLVPVNAEHMYYAAINYKSCKLTAQGQHYWNLVKKNTI